LKKEKRKRSKKDAKDGVIWDDAFIVSEEGPRGAGFTWDQDAWAKLMNR
jgi:hypothetical protein